MKFFIEWTGCSANQSDAEKVIALFQANNFKRVQEISKADLILINSCAVKQPTEKKIIKRVNEIRKKLKCNQKLIVFGCLPVIKKDFKAISRNEFFYGVLPLNELIKEFNLKKTLNDFSFKSLIKVISIAQGCLGECSYCCTKQARGKLKSKTINEIVSEFQKSFDNGAREFWLTAQDCACYGFDLNTNLVALLKEILDSVNGDYRIRIGMLNPAFVKYYFNELLGLMNDKRIYQFLHLPVQSGNNRILKLMNRNYSINEFIKLIKIARKKFPLINITTDFIVAFPSETEKEFNDSLNLIKLLEFDKVNISRFFSRPNIKANSLLDFDDALKKHRSRILTKVAREIAFKRNQLLKDKKFSAFFTEKKQDYFLGRSFNYKRVKTLKSVVLGVPVNVFVKNFKFFGFEVN